MSTSTKEDAPVDGSERSDSRRIRFPPSYWACKKIVENLKRFQDLLRHHYRWAHQVEFARPIHELIPPDTKPQDEQSVIDREINRMLPRVYRNLELVGVTTGVSWTEIEDQWWKTEGDKYAPKKHSNDLLLNCLHLPTQGSRAGFFDQLIAFLDQAIGAYEDLQRAAVRRMRNPLHWIAFVISIPIRIFDRAGFDLNGTEWKIVVWILQVLVGLGLILVLVKLKVSIPWDKVLEFFAKTP